MRIDRSIRAARTCMRVAAYVVVAAAARAYTYRGDRYREMENTRAKREWESGEKKISVRGGGKGERHLYASARFARPFAGGRTRGIK